MYEKSSVKREIDVVAKLKLIDATPINNTFYLTSKFPVSHIKRFYLNQEYKDFRFFKIFFDIDSNYLYSDNKLHHKVIFRSKIRISGKFDPHVEKLLFGNDVDYEILFFIKNKNSSKFSDKIIELNKINSFNKFKELFMKRCVVNEIYKQNLSKLFDFFYLKPKNNLNIFFVQKRDELFVISIDVDCEIIDHRFNFEFNELFNLFFEVHLPNDQHHGYEYEFEFEDKSLTDDLYNSEFDKLNDPLKNLVRNAEKILSKQRDLNKHDLEELKRIFHKIEVNNTSNYLTESFTFIDIVYFYKLCKIFYNKEISVNFVNSNMNIRNLSKYFFRYFFSDKNDMEFINQNISKIDNKIIFQCLNNYNLINSVVNNLIFYEKYLEKDIDDEKIDLISVLKLLKRYESNYYEKRNDVKKNKLILNIFELFMYDIETQFIENKGKLLINKKYLISLFVAFIEKFINDEFYKNFTPELLFYQKLIKFNNDLHNSDEKNIIKHDIYLNNLDVVFLDIIPLEVIFSSNKIEFLKSSSVTISSLRNKIEDYFVCIFCDESYNLYYSIIRKIKKTTEKHNDIFLRLYKNIDILKLKTGSKLRLNNVLLLKNKNNQKDSFLNHIFEPELVEEFDGNFLFLNKIVFKTFHIVK